MLLFTCGFYQSCGQVTEEVFFSSRQIFNVLLVFTTIFLVIKDAVTFWHLTVVSYLVFLIGFYHLCDDLQVATWLYYY